MSKSFYFIVCCCFSIIAAQAQNIFPPSGAAGIATTTPHASAILDIDTVGKGILIPRMTKTQRDLISLPATSLLIYQTNNTPGFYFYSGSAWKPLAPAGVNKSLSNLTDPTAVNVSLIPGANNASDLGTSALRWKFLYTSNVNFGDGSLQNTAFVPYTAGTGIGITGNTINALNTSSIWNAGKIMGTDVSSNPPTDQQVLKLVLGKWTPAGDADGQTLSLNASNVLSISNGNSVNIPSAWLLTGNNGTNPASNFVGTKDAQPLVFRVNNQKAGRIDYDVETQNTAFGYQALNVNTGAYNTANGYKALYSNTTGSENTANGDYALNSNTSGSRNIGIGAGALASNTIGSDNIGIGNGALDLNNGNANIAVGSEVLKFNTTGIRNSSSGFQSLYSNISGNGNTSNGAFALFSNTTGYSNVAVGITALYRNTDRSNLVAVGDSALFYNGLGATYEFQATGNTALGSKALYANTIGNWNTATGYQALYTNITGSDNTANGYQSLFNNTEGHDNVANGSHSLFFNNTGIHNIAIGTDALFNNTQSFNIAIGSYALRNNYVGGSNTSIGYYSLYANVTGTLNTALGVYADASTASLTNATALGYNAVVNASNKVRIGDVNVTVVESQAGSWITSDGRFKNNIIEDVKGLEFIKLLRPVTYNFDLKKFQEHLMQNYPDSIKQKRLQDTKASTEKLSKIKQTGFIAQEVEIAAKKSGYDFNGVHAPENQTDNWSMSYEKLVVPLVKAVQELSKMNDEKDEAIKNLQHQIDELKKLIQPTTTTQKENTQTVVLAGAAKLDQNIPNPFTNSTVINYYLPVNNGNAYINFYDGSGKLLKSVKLSGSGKGTIDVRANELPSGTYQYALMIGNNIIDSKKMILAK